MGGARPLSPGWRSISAWNSRTTPEIAQVGLDGDDHKALKTIITAVVDAYLSERQSKEKRPPGTPRPAEGTQE